MARLWADRLVEVWAEPGRAGSGVVLGSHGILTARHVVEDARGENDVLARVVRPGVETATWTPMEIAWEDPDWDLALLVVDESGHEIWSAPQSPSPPSSPWAPPTKPPARRSVSLTSLSSARAAVTPATGSASPNGQ